MSSESESLKLYGSTAGVVSLDPEWLGLGDCVCDPAATSADLEALGSTAGTPCVVSVDSESLDSDVDISSTEPPGPN